ncbi:hypothetical protein [Streptomyces sp. NPDC040750]
MPATRRRATDTEEAAPLLPWTVEQIAEHRLVYRPHVEGPHVKPVP